MRKGEHTMLSGKRIENISIRIDPFAKGLIDRAASLAGKTRSAFMIETSAKKAEEMILDQKIFTLSQDQWDAFDEMLRQPPSLNKKLRKLLTTKSPWE
jgi:uncharacterized protein (DUF1778 family)